MNTFRELFDERDREEIVEALSARLDPLGGRVVAELARMAADPHAETYPDPVP